MTAAATAATEVVTWLAATASAVVAATATALLVTVTVVAAAVSVTVTVTAEQSELPEELPLEEPVSLESLEESDDPLAEELDPVAAAPTAETVRVLVETWVPLRVVVMSSSEDDPEELESEPEDEESESVDDESEPLDSLEDPLLEPVASEPVAATVAVTYSVKSSVAVLVERIVVTTTVLEAPDPRV